MYGPQAKEPGSFAASCILARRLAQRGVRFIQIWHRGWDQHGNLTGDLPSQCKDTDQPSAALVKDLKRLGMLDDTLVVWTGEFGRTPFREGRTKDGKLLGRDHHPFSNSMFMCGGGLKRGVTHGATDELGWAPVEKPVHPHDLQATILHLLGLDHTRLTYRFQGRDFRLTDVRGEVISDLLA